MAGSRLYQLDALRGIAALMVVIFHYFFFYDKIYGHDFAIPEKMMVGKTGVYLFFMISGFVIFWTLEKVERPLDFIFSRFSRLYPAFWAAATFTFIFTNLVGPDRTVVSYETYLVNLTMIHEYLGYRHVDGVYWTLTIELMFYGLALTLMLMKALRFVDWFCLAWLGLIASMYPFGAVYGPAVDHLLFPYYAPYFIMGVAFYRLWSKQAIWFPVTLITCAMAIVVTSYSAPFALAGVLYVVAFALIINGRLQWLASRPLLWLGSISYCLYLVHQNFGYGLIQQAYKQGISPWLAIIASLLLSLLFAWLLHRYVEQPALKGLRRWYATRKDMRIDLQTSGQ